MLNCKYEIKNAISVVYYKKILQYFLQAPCLSANIPEKIYIASPLNLKYFIFFIKNYGLD